MIEKQYLFQVVQCGKGGNKVRWNQWYARSEEFPSIGAYGRTVEEAVNNASIRLERQKRHTKRKEE